LGNKKCETLKNLQNWLQPNGKQKLVIKDWVNGKRLLERCERSGEKVAHPKVEGGIKGDKVGRKNLAVSWV